MRPSPPPRCPRRAKESTNGDSGSGEFFAAGCRTCDKAIAAARLARIESGVKPVAISALACANCGCRCPFNRSASATNQWSLQRMVQKYSATPSLAKRTCLAQNSRLRPVGSAVSIRGKVGSKNMDAPPRLYPATREEKECLRQTGPVAAGHGQARLGGGVAKIGLSAVLPP